MQIRLEERTPSLNTYLKKWHWRRYHAYSNELKLIIGACYRAQGGRRVTTPRKVRITRYSSRRLDSIDNLPGSCKPVLDALKHVGAIVNDSDRWVEVEYLQSSERENGMLIELL